MCSFKPIPSSPDIYFLPTQALYHIILAQHRLIIHPPRHNVFLIHSSFMIHHMIIPHKGLRTSQAKTSSRQVFTRESKRIKNLDIHHLFLHHKFSKIQCIFWRMTWDIDCMYPQNKLESNQANLGNWRLNKHPLAKECSKFTYFISTGFIIAF